MNKKKEDLSELEIQKIKYEKLDYLISRAVFYKNEGNLPIESVIIFSQIIEGLIKDILQGAVVILRLSVEEKHKVNVPLDLFQNRMLGGLIEDFCIWTEDDSLKNELKDFNNKRKLVIHNLFETISSIQQIEDDVRIYLKENNPLDIIDKLKIVKAHYFYLEVSRVCDKFPEFKKILLSDTDEDTHLRDELIKRGLLKI